MRFNGCGDETDVGDYENKYPVNVELVSVAFVGVCVQIAIN